MRVLKVLGMLTVILLCFVYIVDGGSSYAGTDGYTLGPSDILAVSIFAGGERQIDVELTISSQGYVNFPFIGSVKAAGMTSSEMEKKLAVPLGRDYFVDPQVHVRIKEYHSLHFFISGAVKRPGKYEMQEATKIMDLVAKAEGVTPDSGNIAYVMRDSGEMATAADLKGAQGKDEPIKVDLIKLLDGGDMRHNIALEPGDSIYIPFSKGLNQSDSKVYVSGEVERPDLYQFQPGMSALSVCIMAGGFARHAAPNRTTIVRMENGEQKVIKIDLEDVVKGTIPDVPLKPGDRIHVPESWL